MGTKILRYQVRAGDTLRISRDVTLADHIGGSDWVTESGEDIDLDIHDIELIDRPEPSKPAAKVGDTLTRDHQIPPVGTKVVRVDEYDGRLLIRELQTDGRWHLLNSTEYAKATSLFSSVYDYSVVHLPSE